MLHIRHHVFAATVTTALLTGCEGLQSPIVAPGATPQRSAAASQNHWGSRPAATLVYVSDLMLNEVNAYNYPEGGRVLTLTGFTNPSGVCSDENGNVFVLGDRNDNVIEYAHGVSVPTQTLRVPGWAESCSYDPKSGNLAVTFASTTYGPGVAIFAAEQGAPSIYYGIHGSVIWYCGYDDASNLFCDGQTESVRAAFFVLASGTNQISQVPVSGGEFYELNQIQWDGQYMAVVDRAFSTVSRITFTSLGSSPGGLPGAWDGTVAAVTTLEKCGYEEPWGASIYDGSIVVACSFDSPYQNQDKGRILIWNYPQGGRPVKKLNRFERRPNLPDGVAISVAPSK